MTTPPVLNFSFLTHWVRFLTESPTKGRSYRPKAFWFRFKWNIDRNRKFHCLRGRGIVGCVLGGQNKNGTLFSVLVDDSDFVAGVKDESNFLRPKQDLRSCLTFWTELGLVRSFAPRHIISTKPLFSIVCNYLETFVSVARGTISTETWSGFDLFVAV